MFEYFQDRIAQRATPDAVIVGARRNGSDSWIEPIGSAKALPALMANLVFGLGLPQVVEFFLRSGSSNVLRKFSIVAFGSRQSRVCSGARSVIVSRSAVTPRWPRMPSCRY